MFLRVVLSLLALALLAPRAAASDLSITGVEWFRDADLEVRFTISWDNGWRSARNHDAAWVFFKLQVPPYRQGRPYHARVAPTGHGLIANRVPGAPPPEFEVSPDSIGIMIRPSATHRGDVRWVVSVRLVDPSSEDGFDARERHIGAHGIEMVYVPGGPFSLGEPDPALAATAFSFYQSRGDGAHGGTYRIGSASQRIEIGPGEGHLYYNAETPQYQGDQSGVVGASFPTGFDPFYVMKYELRQGQYADFLNALHSTATHERANFGGRTYRQYRGSIGLRDGVYVADAPERPCNYLSWADAMAYADWAGLRPWTELEYEKAARGPGEPISGELPWGTPSRERLLRYVSPSDDLVWADGLDEGDLDDTNRDVYGASYYWVLDLAGSLWERVVSIGDAHGRAFEGTHGDGRVSHYGEATNPDWPTTVGESRGFGFRGGGYYEHGMLAGTLNPHSPIATRTFGGWAGGARERAYGSRFARSWTANG